MFACATSLFGGVLALNQRVVAHTLIFLRPSVAALFRLDQLEQFPVPCPASHTSATPDRWGEQNVVSPLARP